LNLKECGLKEGKWKLKTLEQFSTFPLAKIGFAIQSRCNMNPDWAEENLQTIRTLMERSALYRRALAPIFTYAGMLGIVAAAAGLIFHLNSNGAFGGLWLGTAVIVVAGAFFIVRRQAFKEDEPFWSPPTRRVAQALLPPLFAGMVLGFSFTVVGVNSRGTLTFLWLFFYGCALHSAGFFMPRGMKAFGWIFIGAATAILSFLGIFRPTANFSAHWLMGFFFGVLHLVYGAYLYWTEKGKNAA
jgi:hypothetical protein